MKPKDRPVFTPGIHLSHAMKFDAINGGGGQCRRCGEAYREKDKPLNPKLVQACAQRHPR